MIIGILGQFHHIIVQNTHGGEEKMISLCESIIDGKRRELKEHGSFSFPVACYSNTQQNHSVPCHWHDELEMLILEKGSALLQISFIKQEVKEGDGCFINAGVLHAMEKIPGMKFNERCLVFHPRLIGGSVDSVFWQKYILPLVSDRSLPGLFLNQSVPWQKEMLSLIRNAWNACSSEKENYELITRDALSQCIGILHRQRPGKRENQPEKALRQGERMKRMLTFLQEHFSETITIRQIASSAAVSESECMRCFHDTIGLTPIAYLKNYRLQYAAELLENTAHPVSLIGERCGFQEMSYFARAFRQKYGCTPSQYRKTSGKEQEN